MSDAVAEPKVYVAIIEGKEIPVPAEIAEDDAAVTKALAPYYPQAREAEITRTTNGDRVVITVTPIAKPKGAGL